MNLSKEDYWRGEEGRERERQQSKLSLLASPILLFPRMTTMYRMIFYFDKVDDGEVVIIKVKKKKKKICLLSYRLLTYWRRISSRPRVSLPLSHLQS